MLFLVTQSDVFAVSAALLITGWEPLSVPVTFTTVGATVGAAAAQRRNDLAVAALAPWRELVARENLLVELVSQSHARGLRVIVDLVMNHTSDQHPWFQASRSDPTDS